MSETPRELLARLGVAEALELRGEDDLIAVALGDAPRSSVPAGAPRRWVEIAALAASLHLQPLDLAPPPPGPAPAVHAAEAGPALRAKGALPDGLGTVCFHQIPDAGGVVNIEGLRAAVRVLRGYVEVVEDEAAPRAVLDGRPRGGAPDPAVVHLLGAGREFVVVNDDGKVRVIEVRRSVEGAAPADRAVAPGALDAPAVAVDALLAGASCEPWLRRCLDERAASPWALDRLAAAGLLVRLWAPADPAETRRLAAGGVETPGDRARRWARALPRERLAAFEALAERDAEALVERVGDLGRAPDAEVLAVLHHRDDLECAALALASAGGGAGAALRESVARVDLLAEAGLASVTAGDLVRGDPRLLAVSWREPDAWWGALALG